MNGNTGFVVLLDLNPSSNISRWCDPGLAFSELQFSCPMSADRYFMGLLRE